MKKIIYIVTVLATFTACKETETNNETEQIQTTQETVVELPIANTFTNSIEKAHQKAQYLDKSLVTFEITVAFGDNTLFEGRITQKTDGSKIRLDQKEGGVIIFDGETVYASNPTLANDPMTRFHIFTWSYFFALPYKLNDPGTIWSDEELLTFGDQEYPTARLTFENGTGDTSKDWYIVYKDPKTNVLDGVAYIVSYGKQIEEAQKEPHFAKYNDLLVLDGIPIATNWSFHNWNKEDGYTDQIGEAQLKNIQFGNAQDDLFASPKNAVEVPMPGK